MSSLISPQCSLRGNEGTKGRGEENVPLVNIKNVSLTEGGVILLRPMVISHLRPHALPLSLIYACLTTPAPQCCCLTTPAPSFKRRGVWRGVWRGIRRERGDERRKTKEKSHSHRHCHSQKTLCVSVSLCTVKIPHNAACLTTPGPCIFASLTTPGLKILSA